MKITISNDIRIRFYFKETAILFGVVGAVVANRLSAKYKTLLIEAGGDPHPLSAFPTTSLVTLNLPLIDWGFKTVPQQHACFGLKGNVGKLNVDCRYLVGPDFTQQHAWLISILVSIWSSYTRITFPEKNIKSNCLYS